eukprot:gene189-2366_t
MPGRIRDNDIELPPEVDQDLPECEDFADIREAKNTTNKDKLDGKECGFVEACCEEAFAAPLTPSLTQSPPCTSSPPTHHLTTH